MGRIAQVEAFGRMAAPMRERVGAGQHRLHLVDTCDGGGSFSHRRDFRQGRAKHVLLEGHLDHPACGAYPEWGTVRGSDSARKIHAAWAARDRDDRHHRDHEDGARPGGSHVLTCHGSVSVVPLIRGRPAAFAVVWKGLAGRAKMARLFALQRSLHVWS